MKRVPGSWPSITNQENEEETQGAITIIDEPSAFMALWSKVGRKMTYEEATRFATSLGFWITPLNK